MAIHIPMRSCKSKRKNTEVYYIKVFGPNEIKYFIIIKTVYKLCNLKIIKNKLSRYSYATSRIFMRRDVVRGTR